MGKNQVLSPETQGEVRGIEPHREGVEREPFLYTLHASMVFELFMLSTCSHTPFLSEKDD